MRFICFYLPQFHPIKENDNWWGRGFTEWTNVVQSHPRFKGHYQPHIPSDLGFYDLRLEETRIAQADLAKQYGIGGFCYYHYWFNGKMLLERPFNEVLSTGKPDFPFCLCWANENWTRRWDGLEKEVLMKQEYENYNPAEHLEWLSKAFENHRYIRINNKPIFLVYRAGIIPQIEKIINTWREIAKSKYGMELYICSVKSWGDSSLIGKKAIEAGFDAVVDFQPEPRITSKDRLANIVKNFPQKIWNKVANICGNDNIGLVSEYNLYDYKGIVNDWLKISPTVKEFPCVAPSWDNSARKKKCTIIQNNNPDLYRLWLEAACKRVSIYDEDEKIVFINAWNEWGEGCHLEPDLKNGKSFLEATKKVSEKFKKNVII